MLNAGSLPTVHSWQSNREQAIERALEHPDPLKPVHLWNVDDVIQWLEEQLQHVSESFRTDAVDGNMLLQLGHEDFVNHLHLTELQTRKFKVPVCFEVTRRVCDMS